MYVRTEPVAEVSSSTAGLTAKIAEFGLDEGSDAAPDVRVFLKGFQETLEREMETKIARVIDAKMSTLTQRLALSEQAILRLHKKMNTKEADVQESLNQIQQKLLQLEVQLSLFSVAKEAEQKKKNDLD
ncbi:unnamed protein product [Peronospora belbahrii]|nr:unnamed protein product [Peronospora belbahrii]